MEFSIKTGSPEKQRTGCVVVGVYEGRKLTDAAQVIDKASGQFIGEVLRRGDHEGKLGTTLLLHSVPKVPADRVLLVGLGREREFGENSYRGALLAAAKCLKTTGTTEAVFCLTDLAVKRRETAWKVEQAVLTIMDCAYRFDRLKSKASEAKRALRRVVLQVPRRNETVSYTHLTLPTIYSV